MAFSILAAICLIFIGQDQVFGDQLYGEQLPEGTAFWNYNGATGPAHWCDLDPGYAQCCKIHKRESPININVMSTLFPAYPIHFKNYDVTPQSMTVQNTGHTVRINYVSDKQPYLTYRHSGGERQFVLDHIHFHWGSKSNMGSEHTINNKHFPMEMHLLHKAPEHDTLYAATQHPESFAVISVLFEVSWFPNLVLSHAIEKFQEAKYEGDEISIKPFRIDSLLHDVHNYFTYNGSLTTPPCSDNVRWIVLKDTLPINKAQLNHFRHLQGRAKVDDPNDNAPIENNFRPTQSLSGRKVLRSHLLP